MPAGAGTHHRLGSAGDQQVWIGRRRRAAVGRAPGCATGKTARWTSSPAWRMIAGRDAT